MVKNRNVALVIIFSIITFGIYAIYWLVKTTLELKELGSTDAPNPWLLLATLIPIVGIFVGIYYIYKYSTALEGISNGATNKWLILILWIVIYPVAQVLIQIELNKHATAAPVSPATTAKPKAPNMYIFLFSFILSLYFLNS